MTTFPSPLTSGSPAGTVPVPAVAPAVPAGVVDPGSVAVSSLPAQADSEIPRTATASAPTTRRLLGRLLTNDPFVLAESTSSRPGDLRRTTMVFGTHSRFDHQLADQFCGIPPLPGHAGLGRRTPHPEQR